MYVYVYVYIYIYIYIHIYYHHSEAIGKGQFMQEGGGIVRGGGTYVRAGSMCGSLAWICAWPWLCERP